MKEKKWKSTSYISKKESNVYNRDDLIKFIKCNLLT